MSSCCAANSRGEDTEKLKVLMKFSSDAVIWIGNNGVILDVNEALIGLTGYEKEEFISQPFSKFFGEQVLNTFNKTSVSIMDKQDYRHRLDLTISPIEVGGKQIGTLVVGCSGVKEQFNEEDLINQIRQLTYYDSLTGLPNMHKFKEIWSQRNTVSSADASCAILLLDMDRFRVVNHYAGYERGDDFMIAVSRRLISMIRQEDIVFHWTSDRFLILLQHVNRTQTKQIVERILQQFQIPFVVKKMEISITPSIGISIWPEDGDDADTLLNNASTAAHFVKNDGKNSYRFYTSNMESGSSPALEQQLRKALERDEFVLHYQPKVDIRTKEVAGVEALLRWNHPEYGLLPPQRFIPLAEESGLIVSIGKWVIETACLQNRAWQIEGLPPVIMSVNLSPRQFKQGNIVQTVGHALLRSGLEAKYLELEITESMVLEVNYAIDILTQLKKLGIHTSLDDFGKGYSSLAYLKSLPLDILKVDSSFIKNCTEDEQDAILLKTIVEMGHNLEMTVVAEGVEALEQLELLKSFGCHQAQGFLLSKPVPAAEVPAAFMEISSRFGQK